MAGNRARGGRRRRVLSEEARAHSDSRLQAADVPTGEDAPRYGEQANIENHPQITDFVPRRRRAIFAAVTGIGLTAAAGQSVAHYASPIAESMPGLVADEIRLQIADGMIAWMSAATLVVAAVGARVIYSLRRHRVDDQHGRYRVWRWAALAAVVWSVNCVAGAHQVVGSVATAVTGWSFTGDGAEWWLIPCALLGVWIASRLMTELAESRLALMFAILAAACYGVAAAGTLGWAPRWLGDWADLVTRSVPLVGHALALGSAALFARHVVLDVQGLVEHGRGDSVGNSAAGAMPDVQAPSESVPDSEPPTSATSGEWVDGSEGEEADDAPRRKLSKAERKRLRKQKMRNRAA